MATVNIGKKRVNENNLEECNNDEERANEMSEIFEARNNDEEISENFVLGSVLGITDSYDRMVHFKEYDDEVFFGFALNMYAYIYIKEFFLAEVM